MTLVATMEDPLGPGGGITVLSPQPPCLLQSPLEEIPEIDVDELLDEEHDNNWAARVKGLLSDCYNPQRLSPLACWTRCRA